LTNLQAAVGLAQFERIDQIVAQKRRMGSEYTQRLKDVRGLQLPTEETWARNVYWMYGVIVDESTGMDALQFASRLRERGVETRPFFLGMHEQPVFHKRGLFMNERYPTAERIARQGLYLPSGLALTPDQLSKVCEAVKEVLS
jgi:perosamine synthetase